MKGAPRRSLLVGAGGMGRAWARNLTEHAERVRLVGWVDILDGAAQRAADEHGLTGIWTGTDLGKALVATTPDFVVDVTVPEAHRDVTIEALEFGVPVLGEKPLAHTMDAAREMIAVSERTGRLLMVSQSRRYDARLAAFKALIDEHTGAPGILNSDFYVGAHFGGFRDQMESPLILDMAIHTFDCARYLSGRDALSVYCEEFNPPWSWYRGDACAVAMFEMTGGLRYTYRGSWCAEGRHTSWESEWRAVGPTGTATWDGGDAIVAERVVARGGFHSTVERHEAEMRDDVPPGIAGSLVDFLDALDTDRVPMGECHDNIKSLAMVFAAMESARTGGKVAVTA